MIERDHRKQDAKVSAMFCLITETVSTYQEKEKFPINPDRIQTVKGTVCGEVGTRMIKLLATGVLT